MFTGSEENRGFFLWRRAPSFLLHDDQDSVFTRRQPSRMESRERVGWKISFKFRKKFHRFTIVALAECGVSFGIADQQRGRVGRGDWREDRHGILPALHNYLTDRTELLRAALCGGLAGHRYTAADVF